MRFLIGQSVEPTLKSEMLEFLNARPEIPRIFNLITLQLGADIMVAIKAEISRDLAIQGIVDEINRVETNLKANFPEVRPLVLF